MNQKITILMFGALLCNTQAHASVKVAHTISDIHEFVTLNPFTSFAAAVLGTALVYHHVPQDIASGFWNITKSQKRIQTEAASFLTDINSRYASGFAVNAMTKATEADKLNATRTFAYNFQQQALSQASWAKKFYTKVIKLCDTLRHYPTVFVVSKAQADLTWAQWYANKTQNQSQQNELLTVINNLNTLIAYLQTTNVYLQEKSNISQIEQKNMLLVSVVPVAGLMLLQVLNGMFKVEATHGNQTYSPIKRSIKYLKAQKRAAEGDSDEE